MDKVQNKKQKDHIPFASIWLWCHCIWVTWTLELEHSDLLQVVVLWTNSISVTIDPASPFIFEADFEFFPWYFLGRPGSFLLILIGIAGVDTQAPIPLTQVTNFSANQYYPIRDTTSRWNTRNTDTWHMNKRIFLNDWL